jgi:hypothetical protein
VLRACERDGLRRRLLIPQETETRQAAWLRARAREGRVRETGGARSERSLYLRRLRVRLLLPRRRRRCRRRRWL